MTGPPPLHPDTDPYAFMLGTWRGRGEGSYPTIDDFTYLEEITFGHVGGAAWRARPFLAYGQKTKHAETGLPLHAEAGYWRFPEAGRVELVIVHPTGLLESLSGTVELTGDGATFELACPDVVTTASAVEVERTVRRFRFEGDTVSYDVAMAAVGQPLTHHLAATLHRAG